MNIYSEEVMNTPEIPLIDDSTIELFRQYLKEVVLHRPMLVPLNMDWRDE